MSSGANRKLETKSRVWSNAMMAMTSPRKMSTETSRGACVGNKGAFGFTLEPAREGAVTIPHLWKCMLTFRPYSSSAQACNRPRCVPMEISHWDYKRRHGHTRNVVAILMEGIVGVWMTGKE